MNEKENVRASDQGSVEKDDPRNEALASRSVIETEKRLRELFPRASKAFFDVNAQLCSQRDQPTSALDDRPPRETKSDARISLCYVLYRVRIFDPENKYAATKPITDCLCQVGLIPGDTEKDITVEVEQVKVNHYHEEKTELKITYP